MSSGGLTLFSVISRSQVADRACGVVPNAFTLSKTEPAAGITDAKGEALFIWSLLRIIYVFGFDYDERTAYVERPHVFLPDRV
jgi:hypothetical protein